MATILVVDDDARTRELLHSILEGQLGHEVLFAADSEAAPDTYAQTNPDVVITDLVMPHLHGVLLIERLMTLDPACKVIAISGKAPEQLSRAEDAGALATLQKPIQRDDLVSAVKHALAGPKPWGRAR